MAGAQAFPPFFITADLPPDCSTVSNLPCRARSCHRSPARAGRARTVARTGWAQATRTARAGSAARGAGCRIVALTDSPASPLALLADATLLFSLHSPSFFPSITSAVALSEALVELLASRAGKGVVQRIDQAEEQLFASGAYLEAPRSRKAGRD